MWTLPHPSPPPSPFPLPLPLPPPPPSPPLGQVGRVPYTGRTKWQFRVRCPHHSQSGIMSAFLLAVLPISCLFELCADGVETWLGPGDLTQRHKRGGVSDTPGGQPASLHGNNTVDRSEHQHWKADEARVNLFCRKENCRRERSTRFGVSLMPSSDCATASLA